MILPGERTKPNKISHFVHTYSAIHCKLNIDNFAKIACKTVEIMVRKKKKEKGHKCTATFIKQEYNHSLAYKIPPNSHSAHLTAQKLKITQ